MSTRVVATRKKLIMLTAVILGGEAAVRKFGAPYWAVALFLALGLAVACLWIVFPQDSADKLAWWRERRR
jgi:hypothetical protein